MVLRLRHRRHRLLHGLPNLLVNEILTISAHGAKSSVVTTCVSVRAGKAFTLVWHVDDWLTQWMREALDQGRDTEVADLFTASRDVSRVLRELVGPIEPSTKKYMPGIHWLIRVDTRLTHRLGEVRTRGEAQCVELWTARRTVRNLMSELVEQWRESRRKEQAES